jgi:DNA-directed RNA polymerase subunit M/transcription elongation factor TFIIS
MSDGKRSKEPSKPRLCERCGSRMPPQKRGRPRRWCSQQCRQSAYEERHGLESWKDKQPKVNDLSDVVEVMQDRAARRETKRRQVVPDRGAAHTSHECVQTVLSDYVLMTFVVEHVTDVVRAHGVVNTFNGRILAEAVAELANVVLEKTAAVVPADTCPGINPPTPRD